jgi:hypothetical protein
MKLICAALLTGIACLSTANAADVYNPKINPSEFSSKITNPLFAVPVGKTMIYEGLTEDGIERVEIKITGETKLIMGVETLVYQDTVTIDGELVEFTKDYLAQDKQGNVWYFGENVDNYEDGKLKDHHGAWIAGKDGAKPGIWMPANPISGQNYRMEYYKGEAEDFARVISTNDTVTVKAGEFKGCLKTLDYTPLEPDVLELKYYCPGVAGQVLTENLATGERFELVSVASGS